MAKPLIGVLMGGKSAEREISLQTGDGVVRALASLGYATQTFDDDEELIDGLRRADLRRFSTRSTVARVRTARYKRSWTGSAWDIKGPGSAGARSRWTNG